MSVNCKKVIHNQNMKKRGKHDISEKLFTLSTEKWEKNLVYIVK